MVATRTVNDPRFPFSLLKRREGDADRVAIALNSSPPVFVRPAVTSETAPGSGHSQVISRSRRPLEMGVRSGFAFGLREQESSLPSDESRSICSSHRDLFMLSKPCENALIILRRQPIDGGLDLFDPFHA